MESVAEHRLQIDQGLNLSSNNSTATILYSLRPSQSRGSSPAKREQVRLEPIVNDPRGVVIGLLALLSVILIHRSAPTFGISAQRIAQVLKAGSGEGWCVGARAGLYLSTAKMTAKPADDCGRRWTIMDCRP
jgi:hypothetical protein